MATLKNSDTGINICTNHAYQNTILLKQRFQLKNIPPQRYNNLANNPYVNNPHYTQNDYNMRRKAEILKYKANSSNITKKQQYANAASNRWLTGRKRSWATQTDTFTNPNTSTLERVGDVLVCNNNNVSCSLTSDANVPGKVRPLCYNPLVPLYNYKVTRTYKSGGTKWTEYGPPPKVSY
jgi:hypothetical protein